MHTGNSPRSGKWRRVVLIVLLLSMVAFALLLIPEPAPPTLKGAGKQAFIWNRQELWSDLEKSFAQARAEAPEKALMAFHVSLARNLQTLTVLPTTNLPPTAPIFDEVETNFFQLAPKTAAGGPRIPLSVFLNTYTQLRTEVKRQS